MFIFVGLGNPGAGYARQRHNVGFCAVDAVADRYGFSSFEKKGKLLVSQGSMQGRGVTLMKPQTFMNLSGLGVAPFLSFYKIPTSQCFVFHDDIDISLGKVKVKTGGGAGGHNGLKSLDQNMGPNYHRVRIGVGRPAVQEMVHAHVLSDFTAAEEPLIRHTLRGVCDLAPLLLEGNFPLFMTKMGESSQPTKEEA